MVAAVASWVFSIGDPLSHPRHIDWTHMCLITIGWKLFLNGIFSNKNKQKKKKPDNHGIIMGTKLYNFYSQRKIQIDKTQHYK